LKHFQDGIFHLVRSLLDRALFNRMACGFTDEAKSLPVTGLFEVPRFPTVQADSIHIAHMCINTKIHVVIASTHLLLPDWFSSLTFIFPCSFTFLVLLVLREIPGRRRYPLIALVSKQSRRERKKGPVKPQRGGIPPRMKP
jgi:hypothetical protein